MWVFTKDGFFSVVEHRADPQLVLIRARTKDDGIRICKALDLKKVQCTPKADYPYRVTVAKARWALYLQNAALDIDYGNFKAAMERLHPAHRMDQLHEVWYVMAGPWSIDNNRFQ